MPNYVYCGISPTKDLTPEQIEIAKKIQEAGGLCRYYVPRPAELDKTTSPTRVVSDEEYHKAMKLNETEKFKSYPITREMQKSLLKAHNFDNWYNWSHYHWGTKWGDCDFDIDWNKDGTHFEMRFDTAWSPIALEIIIMFAKDFPDFTYWWEEEQGWGGECDYTNGEESRYMEYDIPNWTDEEEVEISHKGKLIVTTLTKLADQHPNYDNGTGYYLDYGHEYAGKTRIEALEYVMKNYEKENV